MYKKLSSRLMTFILVLFLLITNGQSTISSVERTVSYRFLIADSNQSILPIFFGDNEFHMVNDNGLYHLNLDLTSWEDILDANYDVFSISIDNTTHDYDFSLLQDESEVVEISKPKYPEQDVQKKNSNTFYILTNELSGWGIDNTDLRLKYRNGTPSTLLEKTAIKYQSPDDRIWYSVYRTNDLSSLDFQLERINPEDHNKVYNTIDIKMENLGTSVLMNNDFGSQWGASDKISTEIKNRLNHSDGKIFSVNASLAKLAYPDAGSPSQLNKLGLELASGWRVDLISTTDNMFEFPEYFSLMDSDEFFINDVRMTNARTGNYDISYFEILSDPVLHLSASTPHNGSHEYMYQKSTWLERTETYKAPNTQKIPGKNITVENNIRYIQSSFYDYLSDFELNGNHRSEKNGVANNHDLYVQFRNYNSALSDYYSKAKVDHPIYTGHFQHDSYGGAVYSTISDSLDLYGYSNYNKFFATNNAMFNSGGNQNANGNAKAIVPNLVNKNLSEEKELMISTGDKDNSVASPFFDKEFLSGSNSKNTVLADIYESVAFPFFEKEVNGIPYWTFDSTINNTQMSKDEKNNLHFLDHNVKGIKNKDSTTKDLNEFGFFPLNNPQAKEFNEDVYKYNYGTGMRMDIPFTMTANRKVGDQDIVFEFSGDDDVWIFIDGKLALDLGGAHGRVEGILNFTKKQYEIQGGSFYKESGTGQVPSTSGAFDFDDGRTQHELTIFYMERGLWESNLKMTFNFPENNNLVIEKEVDVESVYPDFQKFFENDVFELKIESQATHYGEQKEEHINNGFKIRQDQIRDYGSVKENNLTNSVGARYSSRLGSIVKENLYISDRVAIQNKETLVFENQFRLGSYLKITEEYDNKRYHEPLWKVYENGIQVNKDANTGLFPSDGRTEPVVGTGPPIKNLYDGVNPNPNQTIRFGTYIREEDRNSNLIMDVLVVNRPRVQSLEISKGFMGDIKKEAKFTVEINYEGKELNETVILNESNGYKDVINGLPLDATYTVKEEILDGYYVHSVIKNGKPLKEVKVASGVIADEVETIHFVNAPYVDLEVEKIWENAPVDVPKTIKIGLFRDDEEKPLDVVELNQSPWKHTFKEFPMYGDEFDFPIDYKIYELDADGNKVMNGAVIEIDERRYEVTYQTVDGIVQINNRYITGKDFEFRKVRQGTDDIVDLYGAKFKLYRYQYDPDISGDSYFKDYYHNADKKFEVEDLTSVDLDGNVYKLSSLYTDEIYFLEETVVPTGMQKPSGVWMIRINEQGGLDIEAEFKNDMPAFGFDGSELLLYNKPQWILSPTGGSGTRYMMVGLLFMASSGMLYLNNKRRNRMKKTKGILVKVMAFMLVFASLFNPISAEDSKNIVINNVSTNDKFDVYKVIDIEYDETTNTVDYYWLYDKDGVKLQPRMLIDEEVIEKDIRLRAIEIGKKITNPIQVLTSVDETLSYKGEAGGYLFIPTVTSDVYEPMLGFIQYEEKESGYEIVGDTIEAKKGEITIDKDLLESDVVGQNQKINFEITFDVPKYQADAADKKLQVADYMDSGMIFNTESIKIYGDEDLLDNTNYSSVDIKDKEPIFAYEFVYDKVSKYEKIKITYSATVTGDISNTINNKNLVELVYSNYPHIDGSHKPIEDEVELKTAQLKVLKVDENNRALEGAEFALYRIVSEGEDIEFTTNPVKGEVLISTGTSGKDGVVIFDRLAYGNYKLVETKAPFGYQKLREPIEFIISKDASGETLVIEKTVKNIKGFNLPSTGAAGTYAFTVVGLGIMATGVILYLKDKKLKRT